MIPTILDNVVVLSVSGWLFTDFGLGTTLVFLAALLHGIDVAEDNETDHPYYKYLGMFGALLIAIKIVVPNLGGMTPVNVISSVAFGILLVEASGKLMTYIVRAVMALSNNDTLTLTRTQDNEPFAADD